MVRAYAEAATGSGSDDQAAGLAEDLFWTGERLRHEYLDLLPVVSLSRCPYTAQILALPMDTFDLDGLWWAYQTPLRLIGGRPPSLIALTGAVRLARSVPPTPFLVKPGPEAPYVLPRLLSEPDVTAVLSQVPIGAHTGYAIAYFARTPEETVARANDWGADGFARPTEEGTVEWGAVPEGVDDPDFDLGTWIEAGRLRWIAPGDDDLVLRGERDGCPYLDLPGRHQALRIEEGVVR